MTSPTLISLPPHLWMPPDGISFDNAGGIALPAIAASGDVVTFTVPQGFHGVIKRIANVYVGTGFVEFSGSIVWQIKADGGVIRGYDNIVASLGAVNNPSETAGILIYEQQVIKLSLNNVSLGVGGSTVGGRLSGWYYPKVLSGENIWG